MTDGNSTGDPLHTPLHALHESLGARMVEFAGYAMPLNYPTGILKEHEHTRALAALFDVSHMGQLRLTGTGVDSALEALLPIDLIGLPDGRQRYAFLTNDQGGILDDLIVARFEESLVLVVNASRKVDDFAYLEARLNGQCKIETLDDRALLALQGPAAESVLAGFAPESTELSFMDARRIPLLGEECYLSRSGYTGEDGFELSVPAAAAEALARELLTHQEVAPAGLGARDSLRLEAGLCLYGHELDASTTPVEAGLGWAISPARRAGGARPGGYPGAGIIMEQLAGGVTRRRVGLRPQSRQLVRDGSELLDARGAPVGVVTSGGFGPTLGAPVAMAYIDSRVAEIGTELVAIVRGKRVPTIIGPLSAVPHRYARRARRTDGRTM